MSYIPITPFGRSVDATLLKHQQHAKTDITGQGVNKYEIMRELTAARKLMNLSDRELAVLQALLSFFPKPDIGGDQ